MKSKTTIIGAFLGMMLVCACIVACVSKNSSQAGNVSNGLDASQHSASEIGAGVHAATTNTAALGKAIVSAGQKGQAATSQGSPKADPTLWNLFTAITGYGGQVTDQSSELGGLEKQVSGLVTAIGQNKKDFDAYKTSTDKTIADKDAKIASLQSQFMHWIHGLMILLTLGLAADIGLFFIDHDVKITVVVGIVCIVGMVALVIMSRIYQLADAHADGIIIALGAGGAGAVGWFLYDWLKLNKGNFWAAVQGIVSVADAGPAPIMTTFARELNRSSGES